MSFYRNIFISIFLIFNLSTFSQETSVLPKSKKAYMFFSSSVSNIFSEDDNNYDNLFKKIKFSYKTKSPIEFWVEWDPEKVTLTDYGFSYSTRFRKWGTSFFFNNNLEKINNISAPGLYLFSKKIGWIIQFNKKYKYYLKYTNCFDNNNLNELNLTKENDFISFGNLFEFKSYILGYELSANAKDLLTLDLKDGLVNFLIGYKIK